MEVRYYTDPGCIWSWGSEPKVRRLMHEFGERLEFVWVMGGMARRFGPDYRDSIGGVGLGVGCFEDLIAHWLNVTAETGMPSDPRIWAENPLSGTYPACMAVKAAAEQGPDAAYRYLRRLREGIVCERRKLDHPEALITEAETAGLDTQRFKGDLLSPSITEAFSADLEEVRDIPQAARDADAVGDTEGRERVSFPSVRFLGEEGEKAVWGTAPYQAYREAAIGSGAEPVTDRPLDPLEVVEAFGRAATREVEELSELPRTPVEAQLWSLATEGKLRATPALTGILWECA